MEKYDLILIDAHPAEYNSAMRTVDFGKKVCLIEKIKLVGTGLFDGALSSKKTGNLLKK